MGLYEGNTVRKDNEKTDKMKKIVLISIVISILLIIIIMALIMYMGQQPNALTINLNGKVNADLMKILQIEKDDENNIKLDNEGKPIVYAPIKKVAKYFGYDDRNGNYMTVSEDTNSCNVKNKDEVAIFTVDSNIIYKKIISDPNSKYETYEIEENVYQYNNDLYTSREGLELAYNIVISYNSKTNSIDIFTLDYYVNYLTTPSAQTGISKVETWKYTEIDQTFVNKKAILEDLIIVKDEANQYGVVNFKGEKIFSTQYDSLTYIPESKAFLIKSNSQYGIISAKGETKIKPVYNSLSLIDNENQLYLVSKNNRYGIIDINSNLIVPLDYQKIGININDFGENNLTNGYILQDKLIPVQLDNKWGFYNINGKLIGEGIVYEKIGCITSNSQGTSYNVVSISEHNSIVVMKNGKYGCINLQGENTVSFVADDVYMQIYSGETKYFVSRKVNDKIHTKDIADLIK